jgi:GT2 family glycosyltransferase
MPNVSVAIPVRNGGELFASVLGALSSQSVEHELLVCDSGSTDGSVELARAHGARVLALAPELFAHGGVRNRLMDSATGSHVALLTQDSTPADAQWLERLLAGFELADDVAIVYGPYRPRPQAPAPVRIELERWFQSISPDGDPRLDRLEPHERTLPAAQLMGRRGFFTDANACLSRSAWQRVPFREVPYAEDRVLAIDMMRAGYAKTFMPQAAVVHSHHYSSAQQFRRCFDEWRGLLEIYGWREPLSPLRVAGQLRGAIAYARRMLMREGVPAAPRRAALVSVARHQVLCLAGALLGSRADRLPAGTRGWLSLEGRPGLAPLDTSYETIPAPESR